MMPYVKKIINCLKHRNFKVFSILSSQTFTFSVLYRICWTLP